MRDYGFVDLTLFITGPTYVRQEILKAGELPVFGHRDKEAKLRLEPAIKNLKEIAGIEKDNPNYKVLLIPGTGSDALEASVSSLIKDGDKALVVSVGAFGDLYHKIATSNGKNAELLRFEDGKAIDISKLEDKLKENYSVVMFTHNETSTGVMNDVEKVGKLIREYNALPLVDGVSIFGGAPAKIREGEIAMYSTSTQKCLGLPPGFGIAIVSNEALEWAKDVKNRGYLTDIREHAKSSEKFQTANTTPTQLANQLFVQTEYIVKEGIQNRFARHEAMKNITLEWIKTLPEGFELFAPIENASPSVTCIKVPESLDRDGLKEKMREKGYLFDPGYREVKTPTIRIGHIGDISIDMLRTYLDVIKENISSFCNS
ncbi:alanine--glyoxylate aminotransferase family protein [Candidatus Pacearchaeota archaeon]|nr:alanine--glyoxylate aminotransferase family protein [Candidatus Pacearchaeota archaeon]